jgi:molybdopterin/thiamine biosynthesis adenylyltransferase
MNKQFDRNVRFFGSDGQKIISELIVCIAGVGGLGSHVIQQLVYLGVKHFIVIDPECLDLTNLNRYVGATLKDALDRLPKVDLAERIILSVNPDAKITKLRESVISENAFDYIKSCGYLFGCFDNDGPRFIMNELCSAYEIPYIDLASDIHTEDGLIYGGRVITVMDSNSCMMCMGGLNSDEVHDAVSNPEVMKLKKELYGVDGKFLDGKGPSVVSINGVVASLGVTEFIVAVTGVRGPKRYINYRADQAKTMVRAERDTKDCFCCNVLRGKRESANIERYVKVKKLA